MNEYKRILHIIPGYGGGISSHVKNIVDGIDCNKIVIDVASFTDYPDFYKEIINLKRGKCIKLKNVKVKQLIKCICEYKEILKNGEYDAVHLHLSPLQDFYFSILSRIFHIKRIIVHAHIANQKEPNKIYNKIKKKVNQKLTTIFASDFASCSKIASNFRFGESYTKKNRVMHIPNSIQIEKYDFNLKESERIEYNKEFNIKKNQLVIGHVGYFGYQKNHIFMLKIIEKMREMNIDCVWIFVGEGNGLNNIKQRAKQMKIDESIRFIGRRDDVNKIYQLMDVCILPSLFEGLPTVAVEAQAAGIPIVMSDNITKEVDMKMGLAFYIKLTASIEDWVKKLKECAKIKQLDVQKRIIQIKKNKFSTNEAADLYTEFIMGNLTYYNFEEEI